MELTEKEFCEMARLFIEESGWGLTYNEEHAKRTFAAYQADDNTAFVITRKDNELIAGGIVTLDYMAHDEPFGYLVKFYVKPEHRNGKVSMELIRACNKWFDENGAVACFSAPMAKIKDKAAEMLMERSGYNKNIKMFYRG